MCCFLLPFFYTGCEKTKESAKATEVIDTIAHLDTIPLLDESSSQVDSSRIETINNSTKKDSIDNTTSKVNNDDLAQLISIKIPLLSPILVPNPDTYSGLAMFINTLRYISFYGISISFILLTISLIAKYIEPGAKKIILLLEVISFAAFAITRPLTWEYKILWGYWLAFVFVSLLFI
ncbi:MAG: hypothetical protein J7604_13055, partial [Sporocytophaga sp.]|uniref:hypothetical protein n=1 Tax=Sporocytophaga sp. TaxID=2231183 RepID=UPI001AFD6BDF